MISLVDTNVIVYRFDPRDPVKQKIARELLGNGTFAGISVLGPQFEPWAVMVLPGGAFFVLGGWLFLFNWFDERKKRHAKEIKS